MDKNTLSNYGWVVVLVLILSVMIALATPFGRFIATGFEATYTGFAHVANGEDGNKIFEAAGMSANSDDGSGSTDTEATVYTAYHTYAHTVACYADSTDASHDATHGLSATAGLPAGLIVDEAIANYFAENEWVNDLTIDEAIFKSYALKSFVSISDAEWENVKNYTSTHEYQTISYADGIFTLHVGGGEGDLTYSDSVVGYTQSGTTINVYHTINKKNVVDNPYTLFNEADYADYDTYDAAVQEYITANGILYNGLDEYYYTNSVDCHYIMVYECEGLTNAKVYDDRITSTDAVLETNLKIKSVQKVDSIDGANAVAQPTAVNYHNYMYSVFVRTESDEYGSWDVYDYYDFKIYPDEPTIAISPEWNPSIACGCNNFTFNNKNITCACGSFVLTEDLITGDYLGTDYIYE